MALAGKFSLLDFLSLLLFGYFLFREWVGIVFEIFWWVVFVPVGIGENKDFETKVNELDRADDNY